MTIYDVIKKPLVTEKSTALREKGEVYVFAVASAADKPLIKKSIETLFDVKVAAVRTSTLHGKVKSFMSARGRTKSWKKAIVTLSSGKIELFEGL